MTTRIWFVIVVTVIAALAAALIPALPQPLDYHDFADQRPAFGVPNFLNVASNAAFLVVGIGGLIVALGGGGRFQFGAERWPYVFFFAGVLLTSVGSSYYHLDPNNVTLFWDRLPMAVAFMALICGQIVDRISLRVGLVLLIPTVLLGAASVLYWRSTELDGVGNVAPYAVLQVYTIVVMLFIGALPSRYTHGRDLYWVFAWYVLSKILETFDAQVLSLGQVVSGHTLKHLAAAIAAAMVWRMLARRTIA